MNRTILHPLRRPLLLASAWTTLVLPARATVGLKLQYEGHDVRFRNIWIKEMVLEKPQTNFPREN